MKILDLKEQERLLNIDLKTIEVVDDQSYPKDLNKKIIKLFRQLKIKDYISCKKPLGGSTLEVLLEGEDNKNIMLKKSLSTKIDKILKKAFPGVVNIINDNNDDYFEYQWTIRFCTPFVESLVRG